VNARLVLVLTLLLPTEPFVVLPDRTRIHGIAQKPADPAHRMIRGQFFQYLLL
jgi:hypothetical protein